MNSVQIIGNLGQSPELKQTASGLAVLNLSVATSKKVKDKEEWKSTWHRVVLFGKTAEAIALHAAKGSKIFVSGEIENNEWTDKEGNKKTTVQILGNLAYLIEKHERAETKEYTHEDIPF